MSKVNADPQEILKFAQNLKNFHSQLDSMVSKLNASFSTLGNAWSDKEFKEYAEHYQQGIQMIHKFKNQSANDIQMLQKKAHALEEYLRK